MALHNLALIRNEAFPSRAIGSGQIIRSSQQGLRDGCVGEKFGNAITDAWNPVSKVT